jgi:L-lactate dehydrogenase (cytochrome)
LGAALPHSALRRAIALDLHELAANHPYISDLAERARRRIPHFAWEYLDSGTGLEVSIARNRQALDNVLISPRFLKGDLKPDTSTELFGRKWSAPIGVAPVGLTGLMWPGGELMLARMARRMGIPYSLSSFACEGPEAVGREAGDHGWFQLYCMSDTAAEDDILDRAAASGFTALIITVDVPVNSTRERQKKAGLGRKPRISLTQLARLASRPQWALATLAKGKPTLATVSKYFPGVPMTDIARELDRQRLGMNSPAKLERIRKRWKGPLIVKGIMHPDDVEPCLDCGVDGIVVSNHGARQLDAVPASIDVLPAIAEAVDGRAKVLFDSGVRTGLDVLRALALGADFVLAGRPFLYGICALGEPGGDLVATILRDDLANNMVQCGVERLDDLRTLTINHAAGGSSAPL